MRTEPCHDRVTISHARNLIRVYGNEKDHPWFLEWAETIDKLATALELTADFADSQVEDIKSRGASLGAISRSTRRLLKELA